MLEGYCDYTGTTDLTPTLTLYFVQLPAGGSFPIHFGRLNMPGLGTETANLPPGDFGSFMSEFRTNFAYPSGCWSPSASEDLFLWFCYPTGQTPPNDWTWNNLSMGDPSTPVTFSVGSTNILQRCFQTGVMDFNSSGFPEMSDWLPISLLENAAGVTYDLTLVPSNVWDDAGWQAAIAVDVPTIFGEGATIEIDVVQGSPDTLSVIIRNTYLEPANIISIGPAPDITITFSEMTC